MALTLIWLNICAVGFVAGLLGLIDSIGFLQVLKSRPEYAPLIRAHRLEMIWDATLAAALGLMALVAVFAFILPVPLRRTASISTLILAVLLLTTMAVGKFLVRRRSITKE